MGDACSAHTTAGFGGRIHVLEPFDVTLDTAGVP